MLIRRHHHAGVLKKDVAKSSEIVSLQSCLRLLCCGFAVVLSGKRALPGTVSKESPNINFVKMTAAKKQLPLKARTGLVGGD